MYVIVTEKYIRGRSAGCLLTLCVCVNVFSIWQGEGRKLVILNEQCRTICDKFKKENKAVLLLVNNYLTVEFLFHSTKGI
jgi:hypothetical protein